MNSWTAKALVFLNTDLAITKIGWFRVFNALRILLLYMY